MKSAWKLKLFEKVRRGCEWRKFLVSVEAFRETDISVRNREKCQNTLLSTFLQKYLSTSDWTVWVALQFCCWSLGPRFASFITTDSNLECSIALCFTLSIFLYSSRKNANSGTLTPNTEKKTTWHSKAPHSSQGFPCLFPSQADVEVMGGFRPSIPLPSRSLV